MLYIFLEYIYRLVAPWTGCLSLPLPWLRGPDVPPVGHQEGVLQGAVHPGEGYYSGTAGRGPYTLGKATTWHSATGGCVIPVGIEVYPVPPQSTSLSPDTGGHRHGQQRQGGHI